MYYRPRRILRIHTYLPLLPHSKSKLKKMEIMIFMVLRFKSYWTIDQIMHPQGEIIFISFAMEYKK